jgi:hypothetical protein
MNAHTRAFSRIFILFHHKRMHTNAYYQALSNAYEFVPSLAPNPGPIALLPWGDRHSARDPTAPGITEIDIGIYLSLSSVPAAAQQPTTASAAATAGVLPFYMLDLPRAPAWRIHRRWRVAIPRDVVAISDLAELEAYQIEQQENAEPPFLSLQDPLFVTDDPVMSEFLEALQALLESDTRLWQDHKTFATIAVMYASVQEGAGTVGILRAARGSGAFTPASAMRYAGSSSDAVLPIHTATSYTSIPLQDITFVRPTTPLQDAVYAGTILGGQCGIDIIHTRFAKLAYLAAAATPARYPFGNVSRPALRAWFDRQRWEARYGQIVRGVSLLNETWLRRRAANLESWEARYSYLVQGDAASGEHWSFEDPGDDAAFGITGAELKAWFERHDERLFCVDGNGKIIRAISHLPASDRVKNSTFVVVTGNHMTFALANNESLRQLAPASIRAYYKLNDPKETPTAADIQASWNLADESFNTWALLPPSTYAPEQETSVKGPATSRVRAMLTAPPKSDASGAPHGATNASRSVDDFAGAVAQALAPSTYVRTPAYCYVSDFPWGAGNVFNDWTSSTIVISVDEPLEELREAMVLGTRASVRPQPTYNADGDLVALTLPNVKLDEYRASFSLKLAASTLERIANDDSDLMVQHEPRTASEKMALSLMKKHAVKSLEAARTRLANYLKKVTGSEQTSDTELAALPSPPEMTEAMLCRRVVFRSAMAGFEGVQGAVPHRVIQHDEMWKLILRCRALLTSTFLAPHLVSTPHGSWEVDFHVYDDSYKSALIKRPAAFATSVLGAISDRGLWPLPLVRGFSGGVGSVKDGDVVTSHDAVRFYTSCLMALADETGVMKGKLPCFGQFDLFDNEVYGFNRARYVHDTEEEMAKRWMRIADEDPYALFLMETFRTYDGNARASLLLPEEGEEPLDLGLLLHPGANLVSARRLKKIASIPRATSAWVVCGRVRPSRLESLAPHAIAVTKVMNTRFTGSDDNGGAALSRSIGKLLINSAIGLTGRVTRASSHVSVCTTKEEADAMFAAADKAERDESETRRETYAKLNATPQIATMLANPDEDDMAAAVKFAVEEQDKLETLRVETQRARTRFAMRPTYSLEQATLPFFRAQSEVTEADGTKTPVNPDVRLYEVRRRARTQLTTMHSLLYFYILDEAATRLYERARATRATFPSAVLIGVKTDCLFWRHPTPMQEERAVWSLEGGDKSNKPLGSWHVEEVAADKYHTLPLEPGPHPELLQYASKTIYSEKLTNPDFYWTSTWRRPPMLPRYCPCTPTFDFLTSLPAGSNEDVAINLCRLRKIMVFATIAGAGKTYQCDRMARQYVAALGLTSSSILCASPTNAHKERMSTALKSASKLGVDGAMHCVTHASMLGMRPLGDDAGVEDDTAVVAESTTEESTAMEVEADEVDEDASSVHEGTRTRKIEWSSIKVVIIEEAMMMSPIALARLRRLMDRNPHIVWIANGAPDQLGPPASGLRKELRMGPWKRIYYRQAWASLIPNACMLQQSHRVSEQENTAMQRLVKHIMPLGVTSVATAEWNELTKQSRKSIMQDFGEDDTSPDCDRPFLAPIRSFDEMYALGKERGADGVLGIVHYNVTRKAVNEALSRIHYATGAPGADAGPTLLTTYQYYRLNTNLRVVSRDRPTWKSVLLTKTDDGTTKKSAAVRLFVHTRWRITAVNVPPNFLEISDINASRVSSITYNLEAAVPIKAADGTEYVRTLQDVPYGFVHKVFEVPFATTVYGCQGDNVDTPIVIFDTGAMRANAEMLMVAVTRATSLKNIYYWAGPPLSGTTRFAASTMLPPTPARTLSTPTLEKYLEDVIKAYKTSDDATGLYFPDDYKLTPPYVRELLEDTTWQCCKCGTEIMLAESGDSGAARRPGPSTLALVRIDATKGHHKGNVRIACFTCSKYRNSKAAPSDAAQTATPAVLDAAAAAAQADEWVYDDGFGDNLYPLEADESSLDVTW